MSWYLDDEKPRRREEKKSLKGVLMSYNITQKIYTLSSTFRAPQTCYAKSVQRETEEKISSLQGARPMVENLLDIEVEGPCLLVYSSSPEPSTIIEGRCTVIRKMNTGSYNKID